MTQHPISIDLSSELAFYDLTGKWNDYIHVQKIVIGALKSDGFFNDNIVTNNDSGMIVRITAKGIKETLGIGNRFQTLPRKLKELKIATIRSLPDIIQTGQVTEDNVINEHGNGDLFAYIKSFVTVDNCLYQVRISIKKKIGSNIFWIHNVDCIEKSLELLHNS